MYEPHLKSTSSGLILLNVILLKVTFLKGTLLKGTPLEGTALEGTPLESAPLEGAPLEGAHSKVRLKLGVQAKFETLRDPAKGEAWS